MYYLNQPVYNHMFIIVTDKTCNGDHSITQKKYSKKYLHNKIVPINILRHIKQYSIIYMK